MLKEKSDCLGRQSMLSTCNTSRKKYWDLSVVQGLLLLPWDPAIIYVQ